MRIHSTCAACGENLLVTRAGQALHDGCPPPHHDPVHRWLLALHEPPPDLTDRQLAALVAKIDTYEAREPAHYAAALAYAAWGWPIFPCAPGQKTPLIPRADGGRGFHDATTDTEQITAWWRRSPTANVGTPTGMRFDVLDVDPAGLPWWGRAHAGDTDMDLHGTVSTPRGGIHAYLTASGGPNLTGFVTGVDYRGAGGYVLLPPSRVDLGHRMGAYHWITKPSPALTQATQGAPS